MYKMLKNCGLLSLASCLIGCGVPNDNPSDEFPAQLLFQHTNVTTAANNIYVKSEYYSNGSIYFSSSQEKAYLTVNNGQKIALNADRIKSALEGEENNRTEVVASELASPLMSGDEFKITFERENGMVLESTVAFPSFIQYLSPAQDEVIDLEVEDINFEWNTAQGLVNKLYLSGVCLVNQRGVFSFEYGTITFDVPSNKTSLVLSTDDFEISKFYEKDDCSVTARLITRSHGNVDERFAGGSFLIELQSELTFTLTNLKAKPNE